MNFKLLDKDYQTIYQDIINQETQINFNSNLAYENKDRNLAFIRKAMN